MAIMPYIFNTQIHNKYCKTSFYASDLGLLLAPARSSLAGPNCENFRIV